MSDVIIFDSETTGLPDWKSPSGADHQPHLTEIAGIRASESGEVLDVFSTLIKPEGWTIPDNIVELTGVTNEMAGDLGIPEKQAVEAFIEFWGGRLRVAHNTTFDNRIIRIATKRFMSEPEQEHWHKSAYECTLRLSRPFVKHVYGSMPTMSQAFEFFAGKPLEGAHRALADAEACRLVYFAVKEREGVAS